MIDTSKEVNKVVACLELIEKPETPKNCGALEESLKTLDKEINGVLGIKILGRTSNLNLAGIAVMRNKLKFLDIILKIAPQLLCQDVCSTHGATELQEGCVMRPNNPSANTNIKIAAEVISLTKMVIKVTPALNLAIGKREPEAVQAIIKHSAFLANKKQDIKRHATQVAEQFWYAKNLYQKHSPEEQQILQMLHSINEDLNQELKAAAEASKQAQVANTLTKCVAINPGPTPTASTAVLTQPTVGAVTITNLDNVRLPDNKQTQTQTQQRL